MIIAEYLNNNTLVRHYSDIGMMLIQKETGYKYADPIDILPCVFTYEETNEPIEVETVDSEDHPKTAED